MNRLFHLGQKNKDTSSPSSPNFTKDHKYTDKGGSLDRKNVSPADLQKYKSPVRDKDAHSSSSSYYHSSHQHSQPNILKHSNVGSHSTTKNNSEDECSSIMSGSGKHAVCGHLNSGTSSNSPLKNDLFNELIAQVNVFKEDIQLLQSELQDRKDENQRITEEFESFKSQVQSEYSIFHQNLQEERYRFERLEEQMNDLIELHQHEIENLKQGIVDMEEKVQYQSEERLRDIYELLEVYQTRIFRMEHQQQQQFQQLVNIDTLENSNARVFVLKLINVLLTLLQVVLLIVATVASIIAPFIKTRFRVITTFVFLFVLAILYRNHKDLIAWFFDRLERHFPQYLNFAN